MNSLGANLINKYFLTCLLKLSAYAEQSFTFKNCTTSWASHSEGFKIPFSVQIGTEVESISRGIYLELELWK